MDTKDITRRNPERVAKTLPIIGGLYDHYFRCETEGIDNVPSDGPAILFGNHCGSTYTIEAAMLSVALLRRYGTDHPLYYLVHKAFFDIPPMGDFMLDMGAVLADREVATQVLRAGGQYVVFPGGDRDSHKPFSERHRVNFFGRTGFIRMSIAERVPLVPFVHVGTHETFFVLSRGASIAKAFNLKKRLGLNVWPLILSFPFGLSLGPYFLALPLPSKVRMRVLPPYRLWEMGWDDPDNPEHRTEALTFITAELQRALDELAAERRHILLG